MKTDLLLLHGTIYGNLSPAITALPFVGKTTNMDLFGDDTYDWRTDIFGVAEAPVALAGVMTDNLPIEMVHWTASGTASPSCLEWWQDCLGLMVHL